MKAFTSAIILGAKYLELDVQLSSDLIPVVIHDTDLQRVGGEGTKVLESPWSTLEGKVIGEAERFGNEYGNEKLSTLYEFAELLDLNPHVHAFIEIKEESVFEFGSKAVVDAIMKAITKVKSQCTIISFDSTVLFYLRETVDIPVGFVLHKYDDAHRIVAQHMKPDILICNYQKAPDEDGALWPGEWKWFMYEIVEANVAWKWFDRGVEFIETMEMENMLAAINER